MTVVCCVSFGIGVYAWTMVTLAVCSILLSKSHQQKTFSAISPAKRQNQWLALSKSEFSVEFCTETPSTWIIRKRATQLLWMTSTNCRELYLPYVLFMNFEISEIWETWFSGSRCSCLPLHLVFNDNDRLRRHRRRFVLAVGTNRYCIYQIN